MEQFQAMSTFTMFIQLVALAFYVMCLYFILTFFQGWKAGDEERMHKAKKGAVLSLAIALFTPVLFGQYISWLMMR
ncbi:MAG: hypothetical protein ABS951_16855 [Solibacillus sp.]